MSFEILLNGEKRELYDDLPSQKFISAELDKLTREDGVFTTAVTCQKINCCDRSLRRFGKNPANAGYVIHYGNQGRMLFGHPDAIAAVRAAAAKAGRADVR